MKSVSQANHGHNPARSSAKRDAATPVVSCPCCDARGMMAPIFAWFCDLIENDMERAQLKAGVADGSLIASILIEPGFLQPLGATACECDSADDRASMKSRARAKPNSYEYVPLVTWYAKTSVDWRTLEVSEEVGSFWGPVASATKVFALLHVFDPSARAKEQHWIYIFDGCIDRNHRSKEPATKIYLDLASKDSNGELPVRKRLALQKTKMRAASQRLWDRVTGHGIVYGHKASTPRVLLSRLVLALMGVSLWPRPDGELVDVDHGDRQVWHNCAANLTAVTKRLHEIMTGLDNGAISDPTGAFNASPGAGEDQVEGLHPDSFRVVVSENPRAYARMTMDLLTAVDAGKPVAKPLVDVILATGLLDEENCRRITAAVKTSTALVELPDGFPDIAG